MQKVRWLLILVIVMIFFSSCQPKPEGVIVSATDDPKSPMKIGFDVPLSWPDPVSHTDRDDWGYAHKEYTLNGGGAVVTILALDHGNSTEAVEILAYEIELMNGVLEDEGRTYPDSLEIYEIELCGEPATVFERREKEGTTAMTKGESFNIDVYFVKGSTQYSYTLQVDLAQMNNYRNLRKEFFALVEGTTCP